MLDWYKGIEKDLEAIKNGEAVVLHADSNLCRVMTSFEDHIKIKGYPSKERVHAVACDENHCFTFQGIQYVHVPCFEYATVLNHYPQVLKPLYRRYVEQPEDVQFRTFLETWRKSAQDPAPTLEISSDKSHAHATVVITLDNKALGKVDFTLFLAPSPIGCMRVSSFDKQRMVDEIWRLILNYGGPPARKDLLVYVNSILQDFSRQLSESNVEFDPNLFDAK